MRRLALAVVAVALAGGVYGALPPRPRALPAAAGLPSAVRGALHVHTQRSDGTGSVDDVARAARRAGLQFVVLTDHGDGSRAPDEPAYRDGVLIIDAVEIATEAGHLVAVGLPQAPYPLGGEPRDVIQDVARLGGFAIAAHPLSEKPDLRWVEWTAPFGGLEWLNADSEWRDESRERLARVMLAYPFRPVESIALLFDRSEVIMRRWDALTRRRRVVALAAADAHARVGLGDGEPYGGRVLARVPGYETMFRTFSIGLPGLRLTGRAADDGRAVVQEIRAGRVFSSIDAIAPQPAFAFTGSSGDLRATAGEALPLNGPVRLDVAAQAPPGATIALVRDGLALLEASGPTLHYEAEQKPAVYRVEVKLPEAPGEPPVPWIVSNPIYVGRPAAEPAVNVPRARATARLDLYADGAAHDWEVERSASSQGRLDVVETDGGTELRLRYALDSSRASHPYAALVLRARTPPEGYDRLAFRARADRPMRLSLQLRTPGGDAAGQRWHRSVYVDTTPRDIAVFFDEMTPRGATVRPRPNLKETQSILFVVDTVNTKPGSSGEVYLDDVRYER